MPQPRMQGNWREDHNRVFLDLQACHSSTLLKVTVDGFTGREWTSLGYQTGTSRRVTSLQFAGALRAGPLWPEFGVRLPLTARGFPAGLQYILGFSTKVN